MAAIVVAAAMTPVKARAADESVAATVLTINPAFFPLPSNWLRGELFAAPNVKVKVPYTNLPNAYFVHQGADILNQLLHSTAGRKIVLGHSEGAQVEDDWLRRYGPGSDIDPASVTFILTGDPENKYGGCTFISNSGCNAAYGGRGFPADTRYTVKVLIRQYDFWADCPGDLANSVARFNRVASNFVGGTGELRGPHLDYSKLSLTDPGNKSYVEGNATYILGAPATYYLPMVTWRLESAENKRIHELQWRPMVESAYNRPMGTLDLPG
ncbi:PE-PPE domain-containing protein [Mycobacterium sp. TY815]|uniref:PE-PPE domain-containing protein n=1 Tax=Mycobacterium sp. TY815 TaxID=3050581 RepID=UPI002741DA70|nr:PE-PPE domain-containing protein [Mycobacterium sp. TY815]